MASDDDLNLTQWAAVLMFLLLLLVPLAVALAAWAKHRYALAVVRIPSLKVQVQSAARVAIEPDATGPARRLRRRVLALQFVAGLVYWWLLLLAMLAGLVVWDQLAGDAAEAAAIGSAATYALLWPLLLLPPVLGWAFAAGLQQRVIWALASLATLAFGGGLVGAGVGWLPALAAAGVAGLLAAMLAAFLRPAVRGAGPPLVAALTVGLFGWAIDVSLGAALESDDGLPMTAQDWLLGIALLGAMLVPAGWVAWRMLLRLARRYGAKRFSEVQLALGAYWGLITAFAAAAVLLLSFEERTGAAMEWVAAAIGVLWLGWRGLQRLGLWWVRRHAPAPLPALLMLRVFKPSPRSESFTDRFLARWRFAGPVWMIAGPDLAGAYMEPDEFFDFIGRRLPQRFIADVAELPARIAALDGARDPDARCRVNELFCANHTWQAAVLALLARAGVVLLDLREYTAERAGTRFELEAVLRRVPLQRVLVIVGDGDEMTLVGDAIEAAWQRAGSPGDGAALQVLQVGRGSPAEIRGLFRAVARAAAAAPPRSAG